VLELRDVHTSYGAHHVLKGISLQVGEGEIICLIGNNGAGKSTTLMTICGVQKATEGTITFQNRSIVGLPPEAIVRLGISQVPEGRRVFPSLTVAENLALGAYVRSDKAAIERDLARVFELFPRLNERQRQLAGTLSGGERQMMSIGRALMSHPKLLLLDEPSLGLAPLLVSAIFDSLCEINQRGTTILLVEQNANIALQISDRGYVMELGEILLTDDAVELASNSEVQRAYLA
jgi:branched-chain amino acid transport system ATP-binding protein